MEYKINITRKVIIVASITAFVLTVVLSIAVYRIFSPDTIMDTYADKQKIDSLNRAIENYQKDKAVWQNVQDSIGKVIQVYQGMDVDAKNRDQITLDKMKKNEILLRDIQKKYEKVNTVDTFSKDQLRRYIADSL